MATRDDPPVPAQPAAPEELLTAAEAAHLAARSAPGESADMAGGAAAAPAGAAAAAGRAGRPGRPSRGGRPRRAPLPLAAAVATGWAALLSFTPVAIFVSLLIFIELGPTGLLDPLRVAAAGWLLGHGVALQTPDGPIGIAPLAIGALAAWRVARAGVHVTRAMGARHRRSFRHALLAAVVVALGYGGLGALAGFVVGEQDWGVSVVVAGVTLTSFGLLAAGCGSLHATGVWRMWLARLPAAVPAGARAAVVAVAVVFASGAVLAGAAIAVDWREAGDMLAVYQTGVAGQAGLTLMCLAFAPNLMVWATAYLLGPGFAIGSDTVVRSSEVTAAQPLPPLPVFAGVPDGPLPTLGAVLLVVPVIAGALAGRGLARRLRAAALIRRTRAGWGQLLTAVVVAGATAGLLIGAAAYLSGGPLLSGALTTLGPDPLPVAGFAAASVTVGGLIGAGASTALSRRRRV